MTADELIQKNYMNIANGPNFSYIVMFMRLIESKIYSIGCIVSYDVEKKEWHYEIDPVNGIEAIEEELLKEKLVAFLDIHTVEEKKVREKKLNAILSSFSFTYDYYLKKIFSDPKGNWELLFREASINAESFHMQLLFEEGKIETLKMTFPISEKNLPSLYIQWEFAKKYFSGMETFETFLYTKSKDRVRLLYRE